LPQQWQLPVWHRKRTFLDAARNPQMAHNLGIEADTLEGYLFPDTYYFPRGLDSATIIATMVKQFKAAFQTGMGTTGKSTGVDRSRGRHPGIHHRKRDRCPLKSAR
jgi:cell division protein YceG involved in septum cleavage